MEETLVTACGRITFSDDEEISGNVIALTEFAGDTLLDEHAETDGDDANNGRNDPTGVGDLIAGTSDMLDGKVSGIEEGCGRPVTEVSNVSCVCSGGGC